MPSLTGQGARVLDANDNISILRKEFVIAGIEADAIPSAAMRSHKLRRLLFVAAVARQSGGCGQEVQV